MTIILIRATAWILLAIIVALTLVPPAFRPVTSMPHIVEHALIFLLTGAVFALAYEIRASFFFAAAMIFSGCLEGLQSVVPGRHARLSDAVVDALSACIGIAIAILGLRLQQRKMRFYPARSERDKSGQRGRF